MKHPVTVPEQLPTVYPFIVDKLAAELHEREQSRRIPVATAKVLVLMVKLHQKNFAFPPREAVAEHLDVSVQTVDAVLSQRQATRDIRIVHVAMKGSRQARLSVIRGRRIIPSPFLCRLVAEAEAEDRQAKTPKPRRKKADERAELVE